MDSTMTVDAPFKAGAAEQLRFESFKLGWSDGAPSLPPSRPQSMRRPHSRSGSISSSLSSLSFPAPTPTSTTSQDIASLPSTGSVSSKRNSHHRRRSSVSTRHESAEIMGFSLPELPNSSSVEDTGDKDSSRQSALWALEGKHGASVEIPSTPDMEKMMLSFPSKPSFPAGSAFGSSGLSSMMTSKRDSFKLAPKDQQLHTLVEEEEEDDESMAAPKAQVAPPPTPITPISPQLSFTPPAPARTKLSLRPLSLTPESVGTISHGLPTPGSTSAYKHSSLSSTINEDEYKFMNFNNNDNFARKTLTNEASPTPRRPPLELKIISSPSMQDDKAARRSSISYRRSSGHGLPTPDATPTTYSHWRHSTTSNSSGAGSISSAPEAPVAGADDGEFFINGGTRRMSASEQHFLWKSHNALLSRIQDLERTHSSKRRDSLMSSTSSDASDEAGRQVSELTAEREELKRDVEGWRVRVADLEKQIGMVMRRVDEERKGAWVAREKVGTVQAEKSFLERQLSEKDILANDLKRVIGVLQDEAAAVQFKQNSLVEENARLQQRNRALEVEVEVMRTMALASVDEHISTPTATSFEPKFSRRGSFDAEFDPFGNFALSSVEVEDSDTDDYSQSTPEDEGLSSEDEDEDDNGLTGYEDEEEGDYICQSPSESTGSFGSPEIPFSISRGRESVPAEPLVQPSRVFQPKHQVRGSLSKTWAWPTKTVSPLPQASVEPVCEGDKFFACLDESSSEESLPMASRFNFEDGKTLFCQGLQAYDDEDDDPFYSTNLTGKPSSTLLGVAEEDEDTEGEETQVGDDDMFGDVGGIKITFTPAEDDDSMEIKPEVETEVKTVDSKPAPSPMYFEDSDSEDEYEASVPFTFGRKIAVQTPPFGVRSNIPRPVTIYRTPSSDSMISDASSTASDLPSPYTSRPSFIPQPSSSPVRKPSPSFMRQPARKAATVPKASENNTHHAGKGGFSHSKPGDSKMMSIDLSSPFIPAIALPEASCPNTSPSLFGAASKLTFQSFTNLISSPWATTTTTTSQELSTPKAPSYVSKEIQLKKLRQRLVREQEHRVPVLDFRAQCYHPNEVVNL